MNITGYVSEKDWHALVKVARGGHDFGVRVSIKPFLSEEAPCQISLNLDEHDSGDMFICEQNRGGIVVEYSPSKGLSMAEN